MLFGTNGSLVCILYFACIGNVCTAACGFVAALLDVVIPVASKSDVTVASTFEVSA